MPHASRGTLLLRPGWFQNQWPLPVSGGHVCFPSWEANPGIWDYTAEALVTFKSPRYWQLTCPAPQFISQAWKRIEAPGASHDCWCNPDKNVQAVSASIMSVRNGAPVCFLRQGANSGAWDLSAITTGMKKLPWRHVHLPTFPAGGRCMRGLLPLLLGQFHPSCSYTSLSAFPNWEGREAHVGAPFLWGAKFCPWGNGFPDTPPHTWCLWGWVYRGYIPVGCNNSQSAAVHWSLCGHQQGKKVWWWGKCVACQ